MQPSSTSASPRHHPSHGGGHRPSADGSPGDRRAADYIRDYYQGLGLAVTEQSYEVETASTSAIAWLPWTLPWAKSRASPSCFHLTAGGWPRAELVFVDATARLRSVPRLQGKVVLWCSTTGGFRDLLRWKPAAILRIGQEIGSLPKQFLLTKASAGPYERVPVFHDCLSRRPQRLIRERVRTVRLFHRSRVGMGTSRNVVAELRERISPTRSWSWAATWTPRRICPARPTMPPAVRSSWSWRGSMRSAGASVRSAFVRVGRRGRGLIGSRHYIDELKRKDKEERAVSGFDKRRDKTELERHVLTVCLDAVGMTIGENACMVHGPRDLLAQMRALANELGQTYNVLTADYWLGLYPLCGGGYPSVTPARKGGAAQFMHTPEDDLDLLDAPSLAKIGLFVDTFLQRTANAQVFPVKRKYPTRCASTSERCSSAGETWKTTRRTRRR